MSRIIFLSDVFDVKNEHTVPRSHFLNDEHRRRLYENSLKENYEFLSKKDSHGNLKIPKYTFWGRYAGPYVVASNIKKRLPDWEVIVIDWFTKIPEENFHDYYDYIECSTEQYDHKRGNTTVTATLTSTVEWLLASEDGVNNLFGWKAEFTTEHGNMTIEL